MSGSFLLGITCRKKRSPAGSIILFPFFRSFLPSLYHSMAGIGLPSARHLSSVGSPRRTTVSEGCSAIRGGFSCPEEAVLVAGRRAGMQSLTLSVQGMASLCYDYQKGEVIYHNHIDEYVQVNCLVAWLNSQKSVAENRSFVTSIIMSLEATG